jgi:hypothetical protein
MYPVTDVEYRFESEAKVLRIEKLRSILETEQLRPISYIEAEQIAGKILNFFLILAGDSPIVAPTTIQPIPETRLSKLGSNQLLILPFEVI